MTTFLIATRNAHKVQEIRQILSNDFQYLTLNDFPGAPVIAEDADTFEGNAAKKALGLVKWLAENPKLASAKVSPASGRFFVVADDSGLEVDALNGAPGVHSARFAAMDVGAAGNSPDSANNAKLLRLLQAVPAEKRSGRFRCVLAVARVVVSATGKVLLPTPEQVKTFSGSCEGRIANAPSGRGGFGYDPLFYPAGHEKSFAELGDEIKNQLSHRARALEKFRKYLDSEYGK